MDERWESALTDKLHIFRIKAWKIQCSGEIEGSMPIGCSGVIEMDEPISCCAEIRQTSPSGQTSPRSDEREGTPLPMLECSGVIEMAEPISCCAEINEASPLFCSGEIEHKSSG